MNNGNCEFSTAHSAPTDGGCQEWDWAAQTCLACSKNWVSNSNGICVPVSADCRTHNEAGHCTGCYKGYDLNEVRDADNNLIDVTCVYSPSNTAAPAMFGCKIWNWDSQTCEECSNFWFRNADGVCA